MKHVGLKDHLLAHYPFQVLWSKVTTDRALVLFIVLTAVGTRLLFLPIPFQNNPADGSGYFWLADLLVGGEFTKFIDTIIYRTPAYPAFLALINLIFGSHYFLGIMIIQHLMGVIMYILVYVIGREIFGKGVAFTAAVLGASNIGQVYWEHTNMTDFFFTFLVTWSLYYLVRALKSDSKRYYLYYGAITGLGILCRPVLQLYPFLLVPVIYLIKGDIRRTVRIVVCIFLPITILVLPWMAKNYLRHGYFGVAPFLGATLMSRTANHMNFDGGKYPHVKEVFRESMREHHAFAQGVWADVFLTRLGANYSGSACAEANRIFKELAVEAVLNNPERYLVETLHTFVHKFAHTCLYHITRLSDWFADKPFTETYKRISHHLCPKMWLILPWAFIGMVFCFIKQRRESYPILILLFYLTFIPIFVVDWTCRYRLPIEPYLYLLGTHGAASSFGTILSMREETARREALKRLFVILLSTILVFILFWLARDYTDEYYWRFKGPHHPISARFVEDGGCLGNHIRVDNAYDSVVWVEVKYSSEGGGVIVHSNDQRRCDRYIEYKQNGDVVDIFFLKQTGSSTGNNSVEVTLCYIDESYSRAVVQ